jgi:hypothetical protein
MCAYMRAERGRAALIYQHSTTDRQRTLANAVADRTRFELGAEHVRGTGVARADREAE